MQTIVTIGLIIFFASPVFLPKWAFVYYMYSVFAFMALYILVVGFHKPSGDAWLLDREWRMFLRYKGFDYINDEAKLEREFSKWLKRRGVIE